MIKRIIFDIDNTLLNTSKDCIDAYSEYFKNKNINAKSLYDLIDVYENNNGNYEKDDLELFIKNNLDVTFDINAMLDIYGKYGTILNENVKTTLDYLSKKYELVTLSNWYIESQKNRLSKTGILKYFKHIYGFDDGPFKPDERAFIKACGNYQASECLMVGDSIKNDIEVPYKMGLNVIYIGDNSNYPHINNIIELKELL